MARDFPAWVGQSARFGVVGVIALAIDVGVLEMLVRAGMSPYLARVFSLAVMVCATWWLNRTLTFRTQTAPSLREFAHYVMLALAGLALNYGLFSAALWLTGSRWVGIALGTAAAAVFNYIRDRELFAPV